MRFLLTRPAHDKLGSCHSVKGICGLDERRHLWRACV